MNSFGSSPLVYYPKTVSELLNLYKNMPDSLLFAGGTGILQHGSTKYPQLPRNLIFLRRIEELSIIRRSEGYLEIGACAQLNKILGIGEHVLKKSFYTALKTIGTKETRNLATLGGNICGKNRRKSLIPLLMLLDARLELRKQGSSRWVNIKKFLTKEEGLRETEILTRIRIPFNSFNHQQFKVTGDLKSDYHNAMTFSIVATVQKEVLTEIRFAAGYGIDRIFRVRDFEDLIAGRKLPIYGLPEDPVFNKLVNSLKNSDDELTAYLSRQIQGLFLAFIHILNDSL